jgi:hypothetical protein
MKMTPIPGHFFDFPGYAQAVARNPVTPILLRLLQRDIRV